MHSTGMLKAGYDIHKPRTRTEVFSPENGGALVSCSFALIANELRYDTHQLWKNAVCTVALVIPDEKTSLKFKR